MINDTAKIRALLRTNFQSFVIKAYETLNPGKELDLNWHIELMCWMLVRTNRGDVNRLVMCLCPRSLKTLITSVAFPAWCLGNDPTKRFICISYSEELAAKNSRDFQRIVRAPWYKKTFPMTLFDNTKFTEREVVTTKNGFRFSTSVGGTLTGRGGDCVIIDDPIKADGAMSEAERNHVNEWFTSTVPTRFDTPNEGVLIIVSQRTHVEDLVGYVLDRGDWENVSIPAIAMETEKIQIGDDTFITRQKGDSMQPSRMDLSYLENRRREQGAYHFESQFQQNPVPREGNLVKESWLRCYEKSPLDHEFDCIVQSWDTASSAQGNGSYSVCTTWGMIEHRYYLLHVLRDRFDFPSLLAKAKRHAREYGADHVLIEDASSGRQLIQSLHHETALSLSPIPVDTDKITRLEWVSSYIERGRVYLPEDAPWLGEFLKEVLAFPNGKHDDQVDSLSQFLRWAMDREQYQPLEFRVRFFGKPDVRDRYRERMGISGLPKGW